MIGVAGQFPGAPDLDAYWDLLVSEREGLRDFSPEELEREGISPAEYLLPSYVRRGADLPGCYDIEPKFFGISPAKAETFSPQIRMFLKVVWNALEGAGYPEEPVDERIGVFAGCGYPNYLYAHMGLNAGERLYRGTGNANDFYATRIAYTFGLTGPAITLQTACSTSLVAVNEACEALYAGRCEMAIAGGSSTTWVPNRGYDFRKGFMYSPDGRCRVFDANAKGTVFSAGAGAVLLKPLDRALRDGDHIRAVIRGIAINNDGNRKGGYVAPSIEGQSEVILDALRRAHLSPDKISLVEAHGTATLKGDPVEIAGLSRAWRATSNRVQDCPIGSVKSNIGHADAAAGIAGLIKVILSLENETIPASLHIEKANPSLRLKESPFYLQAETTPWKAPDETSPRVAAISSFGIGGTNAHAIVEEAPRVSLDDSPGPSGPCLLPLSSHSAATLSTLVDRWKTFADSPSSTSLPDAAFALQQGRRHDEHRTFVVAERWDELPEALISPNIRPRHATRPRQPVFLFTGQGVQFPGMAHASWKNDSVFRAAFDRCAELLQNEIDIPLPDLVFSDPESDEGRAIHRTEYSQPALFAVQWAQAQRWHAWNIEPVAVAGHSIGEYVAATFAGIFRLEDVLPLVALRGRLMAQAGGCGVSGMLAVMTDEVTVTSILREHPAIDLAAVNSSSLSVVAGARGDLDLFGEACSAQGIRTKRLETSAGFHSRYMEPILDEFESAVAGVEKSPPRIPILSNVTGTWLRDEEATSASYYARHIRSTVRFRDNLVALAEWNHSEPKLFLEMGPGHVLTSFASECDETHAAISTLPGPMKAIPSHRFTLESLGQAWSLGTEVNWGSTLSSKGRRRVLLPPRAFEEQTCRSKEAFPTGTTQSETKEAPSPVHRPIWQELPEESLTPTLLESDEPWLHLESANPAQRSTVSFLSSRKPIVVRPGRTFRRRNSRSYELRPAHLEDYRDLLRNVWNDFRSLGGVVHAWSFSAPRIRSKNQDALISLLHLGKALGEKHHSAPVSFNVIVSGWMNHRDKSPDTDAFALVSATSVLQRESPGLVTHAISLDDIPVSDTNHQQLARIFSCARHLPLVGIRGNSLWQTKFAAVPLPKDPPSPSLVPGTYILTGGLGDLALACARRFTECESRIHLVLLTRPPFPSRERWTECLATSSKSEEERTRNERIRAVQRIESLGCSVEVVAVDVAERAPLHRVLRTCEKQHGPVRGVIHAAGVLRDGSIATKSPDDVHAVYQAKVEGARNLINFFLGSDHRAKLDFLFLFSSISSYYAPRGQFDYAAASAALEALALAGRKEGLPSTCIAWSPWQDIGMSAAAVRHQDGSHALDEEMSRNPLPPDQALDILMTLTRQSTSPRIVVSTVAFDEHYERVLADRQPRISAKNTQAAKIADNAKASDPLESILRIWRKEMKDPSLGPDDDYFDSGGDSVTAVRLLDLIQEHFDRPVPMSLLMIAPTPRKLVAALNLDNEENLDSESQAEIPSHIVPLISGESATRTPLFCFHAIDGNVLFYQPFAQKLTTSRPVYAVESPFLHDTEYRIEKSIQQIAARYLESIRQVYPQGPLLFCGYSFGGLLAYETARLARERGEEVEGLLLLDMFNPANAVELSIPKRLNAHWQRNQHLTFPARIGSLSGRVAHLTYWMLRQLGTLASHALPKSEIRKRRIQAHLDYLALIRHYRPKSFDGKTLLVSTEDPGDKFAFTTGMRGWEGTLQGETEHEFVSGNHLEIFAMPHAERLLRAANRFLIDVDRSAATRSSQDREVQRPS